MKRPAVLDINDMMVKRPAPAAPEPAKAPEPVPPATKGSADTFRTSIYFGRQEHDVLRKIAFEERKAISDLVREGLDYVLKTRGFPPIDELRKGKA
jgi:hypothetical protein